MFLKKTAYVFLETSAAFVEGLMVVGMHNKKTRLERFEGNKNIYGRK